MNGNDRKSSAEAQQLEGSPDPAAAAFEALREEVALVRCAVAGLAAERTAIEIPDYSETLGQIMRASAVTANSLKALAEMPALRLTAQGWARELAAAGEQARRADHRELADAKETFEQAVHDVAASLRSTKSAETQREWLLWAAAGGVIAGILFLATGIAPLLRIVPESWNWPERVAANIVGMDQEAASARLIETAAPDRWQEIVLGYRVVNANRDAISRCETAAAKKRGPMRCTVRIGDTFSK